MKINVSFVTPEFLSVTNIAIGRTLSGGVTVTITLVEFVPPESSVTNKVTVYVPSVVKLNVALGVEADKPFETVQL